MKNFFIFFSIVATIAVVAGKKYCEMDCKDYVTKRIIKHIGCNHSNKFDKNNCPRNAKLVPITEPLKQILLDAHNKNRDLIAGGGDPKHKPACRMATMEWDNELAELAALNVRQCKMKHDKCHNTNNFEFSGQNLYISSSSPVIAFNNEEKLKEVVNSWFSERNISNQNYVDSYPPNPPKIGHFTVMVADRNIAVGCAAATYSEDNFITYLTACNYATNNMRSFPIYEKCKSGGEKCQTQKNNKYKHLCSTKEIYEVNKWY